MRLFLFLFFVSMAIIGCGNSENSAPTEDISSSGNLSSSSENGSNEGNSSSSDYAISSSDGYSSTSEEISSSSFSSNSSANSSSNGEISSSSGSSSSDGNISSSSGNASYSSSSQTPITTPEAYEKLTTANASKGWASRYWDGCKPHCSWRESVDTTAVPFSICRNCDASNKEIAAFTISPNANEWWTGYEGTKNSCDGGVAYTCFDMAPIKINDTLSYAFAAAPGSNAACGQCFQLQFDGGNKDNQVKQAHSLIAGKTLIVMASNIGHDVESGQFDILVPGGGVGAYDSFSNLLGVNKDDLGVQYGGFLSTCQQTLNDYDLPAASYKSCVIDKCNEIFGRDAKFADLLNGCLWFADWYETADNPTYLYKKVTCPDYLTQKYLSTINTSKDTDRGQENIY